MKLPHLIAITLLAAATAQAQAPHDTLEFNRAKSSAAAPPHRFAEPLAKTVDSHTDGEWSAEGDRARWVYRLQVPGASSVSFHAPTARLPAETDLFVGGVPHGHGDISTSGMWSQIIQGELLEIEAWVPVAARSEFRLVIAEVQAGFREAPGAMMPGKADAAPKAASTDSRNFACFRTPENEDVARAVVRLSVANAGGCTATFVNNTNNDRRPFLITARHCAGDTEADLDLRASGVRVTFNAETPCGTELRSSTGTGSQLGAVHRMTRSDIWLVEMNAVPPSGVVFAGIDARTAARDQPHPTPLGDLLSVTHARGLDKQIFLADSVVANLRNHEIDSSGAQRLEQTWQGIYSVGHERATTFGASGASLMDGSARVSGILSRFIVTDPCPAGSFDAPDAYGCPIYDQAGIAWDKGFSSQESLSNWLAPGAIDPPLQIAALDTLDFPTVSLTTSKSQAKVGEAINLTWSSTQATGCVASGAWAGNKAASGTEAFTPTGVGVLTFTLACSNSLGAESKAASVTVVEASSGGGGGGGSISLSLLALLMLGRHLRRH